VAGARAIDVGAAVGGFTQALLGAGAKHVTAVDVGRGQLHPALRGDARVESHERTDLRRIPLAALPGPFDFFCVDVSFAAARNLLRPLAFRLRPGARGVVLVKPQFELPDRLARRAALAPARVRALALARFAERAGRLGFAIEASCDSPVPGRGGTIEVLAKLRFDGPAPGARRARGGRDRAVAAAAAGAGPEAAAAGAGLRDWFAVCAPGGETAVAREISLLPGASEASAQPGGVRFRGDLEAGLRANLWLRGATRVLLRVGELRAREFAALRRGAARLDWARWLAPGARVALRVAQKGSRLYHTGAVAENLALSLRDALGAELAVVAPSDADQTVFARGERDRWTFSIDASGERLDRRGWRLERGAAALRETLGALVLELCEWTADEALVDPLCGSGTFAIEAAQIALDAAPGLARRFACEAWPACEPALVLTLRREAGARRRASPPAPIVAADRSAAAVARARRNAERAGCADAIRFLHAPFDALEPPAERGLVVLDPPYGRRASTPVHARGTAAALVATLRGRWRGWRAALLTPDPRLAARLDLRPYARHLLPHGGLRVHLFLLRA
jgi:putative N6-adenine-specific DNA methylase